MIDQHHIPIIRLHDNLIVCIQTELSDHLVLQLKEDISEIIMQKGAKGLVIDVSGIDIMDSYISRTMRDIGLIAKLMGVRTVLCGLDPMIAMTLVEMGMDLKGMATSKNLEAALQHLDDSLEGQEDIAQDPLSE